MMQTNEIIGLIKGETDFTETTLLGLKNLVDEYPFFQTAQLLYTLNLQAVNDSRFNAELRKAACLLGDRRNLFYRIKSDYFPPEWIKTLEQKEDSATDSSFELVDFFLAGQEEKEKNFPSNPVSLEGVSTDYLSHQLSQTPDDANLETKPMQHQDTIDKFLAADEKSPVKIVLNNQPDNESDGSLSDLDTEEDGFFSETLAKIYLKQKNYEKSLEILRKLYLLYPEKNCYFADQIRFLEKLVNNTQKTE